MWFLGYCQGGHTTKAEGNGERILRQFYVEREIAALGVECWVPREIKFIRRGKQRRAEPHERPYLQNYIFINSPVERFLDVSATKYLGGTLMPLRRDDIAALCRFRADVDARYEKARHAARNQEAISEYVVGQKLQALTGGFSEHVFSFIGMVERAHDLHPKVRASMEFMGRVVPMEFDPLDIKAAE